MGKWAQYRKRGTDSGFQVGSPCPEFTFPADEDWELGTTGTSYHIHIVTPAPGATFYFVEQNLDGAGYTNVGEFPVGDDFESDPLGEGRDILVKISWEAPPCPAGPPSSPKEVFT